MEQNNPQLTGEFSLTPQAQPPPPVPNTQEHPKVSQDPANAGIEPEKHPVHFYSSFCEHPEGVSYISQESDEDILLLIRRDFITNVPWIAGVLLLIAIPIILTPFASVLIPFIHLQSITQIFLLLFYYLVVFGFILLNFSLWYFHVSLLTNKRIIDVDLYGILVREVAETKLDLVEDVSYTQVGTIQSLFDFGNVDVQTAGPTSNRVEFDQSPKPARIAQIIGNLIG